MIQRTFHHHSTRVIALARLVLAAVFLVALWLDPSRANPRPDLAFAMLGAYIVWAAVVLVATWRSWWLEFRLEAIAHLIDVAAFGALVYVTDGYTSPFYTFFVFLLLSTSIRWSWRETALTAAAVLVLFAASGWAVVALSSAEINPQGLLIQFSYLIVLSLVFIWFGINQPGDPAPVLEARETRQGELPPIEAALRHAADMLRAPRLVCVWWQKEEPWINLCELEAGEYRSERIGPQNFGEIISAPANDSAFLFNAERQRALCLSRRDAHELEAFVQTFDPRFVARFHVDEGLAIRIRAWNHEGEVFAMGMKGLCTDDLKTAEALGHEISARFDRSSMVAASEEAAVNQARISLARDLHDTVVQVLAGASFRLEALKTWIAGGNDPAPEIEAIKAELVAEQRNLRSFISEMRSVKGSMRSTDLMAGLPALAEQLQQRWNLECELRLAGTEIEGKMWMEHELHQIVREAAANAARHGKATTLSIDLRRDGGNLEISIADNGVGFPAPKPTGRSGRAATVQPWSVYERVKALGGTLSLASDPGGARLDIRVPLEDAI